MSEHTVILKAEHICKYFGGLHAVEDVSMDLYNDEIIGLIGPNGAGKTTFFNMISGVLPLTKGSIHFEGKEIKQIKSHKMAELGIGRTYQIVQPFSNLTVLENAMVGAYLRTPKRDEASAQAMEALKIVELDHKADIRGADLSLLDLKRLEVARALATQPKVLLLDEVMAGLNPAGHEAMIEIVKKIHKNGIAIIIIEHNMRVIMELSDRIYVLNDGKLLASGKPEEVANNPAVIESYLGGKKS